MMAQSALKRAEHGESEILCLQNKTVVIAKMTNDMVAKACKFVTEPELDTRREEAKAYMYAIGRTQNNADKLVARLYHHPDGRRGNEDYGEIPQGRGPQEIVDDEALGAVEMD